MEKYSRQTKMKHSRSLLFLVLGVQFSLLAPILAATPRLLLVADEAFLQNGKELKLDIYLVNDGSRSVRAPAFERISIDYVVHNVTDSRTATIGSSTESTTPKSAYDMRPHSVVHRRIYVKIPTQVGNFVEVSAEIRNRPRLRSNTIVLFHSGVVP